MRLGEVHCDRLGPRRKRNLPQDESTSAVITLARLPVEFKAMVSPAHVSLYDGSSDARNRGEPCGIAIASIYIETSIVGYLTARSSTDVIFRACQELTRRWWADRCDDFDLFLRQLVLDEASAGDPSAASVRFL